MSSSLRPCSFWAISMLRPSYVNVLEHRRPNVQAMRFRHLLTRRASRAPVTLAWHDIPTSATFDRPISAALTSASGLAEYVYRDPAVARTPCTSVTTVG